MTPRILLEGIVKRLRPGTPPVLDGIDWRLEPGQRVGLVGLNGAGKTTLARIMAGLIPPDRGRVWIDGRALRQGPWRALELQGRSVQLVLQNPSATIHPRLRVEEALRETLAAHPVPGAPPAERQIRESLEAFDLSKRADAFPGELSGGELRRLSLARALLARPGLLLLDEPTAGLDALLKAMLIQQLHLACPSDTTVVWISHDLEVLRCTCDRVVVLHAGRLVETLEIERLRPGLASHPLTSQLVDAWEAL